MQSIIGAIGIFVVNEKNAEIVAAVTRACQGGEKLQKAFMIFNTAQSDRWCKLTTAPLRPHQKIVSLLAESLNNDTGRSRREKKKI